MAFKKGTKFKRMPEVKYRKMLRDRERLLKLKALLRQAYEYVKRL